MNMNKELEYLISEIPIFNELEAMQQAGIPAEDLIVMATKNGAEAMDRIEDFGTIETGKMADLVILSEDPGSDITNMRSVEKAMKGGKFWQKFKN